MKKILFLLAVIAITSSCNQNAQDAPSNTDLLADNLNGAVKQTVKTDYKVDSTGAIGNQDSCCVVTMDYNQKGYITQWASAGQAPANPQKENYEHYDNGAMKKITMFSKENQTGTVEISTDEEGRYSGARELDSANNLKYYYNELSQNEYGGLKNMKQYNADSTLNATMAWAYDSTIRTGFKLTDSLGKVVSSVSMTLGDKKNVVEEARITIKNDSTTKKIIKYTYGSFDDKGNWTQRTEMDENGKPVKIVKRVITYYEGQKE